MAKENEQTGADTPLFGDAVHPDNLLTEAQQRGRRPPMPDQVILSDEELKEDIILTLHHHPEVDAGQVHLEVEKAEVHLRGTVDSLKDKLDIERIVDAIPGVNGVNNYLEVKRSPQEQSI